MLARTTSGGRPTPRWSIPEAMFLSEKREAHMRSIAKNMGINVYGGNGSHFWFWWTKEMQRELPHEVMRDLTISLLNANDRAEGF